jgi:hypothetical protein
MEVEGFRRGGSIRRVVENLSKADRATTMPMAIGCIREIHEHHVKGVMLT